MQRLLVYDLDGHHDPGLFRDVEQDVIDHFVQVLCVG